VEAVDELIGARETYDLHPDIQPSGYNPDHGLETRNWSLGTSLLWVSEPARQRAAAMCAPALCPRVPALCPAREARRGYLARLVCCSSTLPKARSTWVVMRCLKIANSASDAIGRSASVAAIISSQRSSG
jgi:hypothetical protein